MTRGKDVSHKLTWIQKGKIASTLARRDIVGWSWLAADLDASVAEIAHAPCVLYVVYDERQPFSWKEGC